MKLKPRDAFVLILVFALFGVLVPWIKGWEFLNLLLLLPYSCLSFLFVAPWAVESTFGAEGKRLSLSGLGQAVTYGWGCGIFLIGLGLFTVNYAHPHKVLPPAPILLCLLVLSLLGCLLVAAIGAWVAMRAPSADAAKRKMRLGFLVFLCLVLGVPRLLPDSASDWMLEVLTPEGLVTATMFLTPVIALAGAVLLERLVRRTRYTD
jgi:hypothetical protein